MAPSPYGNEIFPACFAIIENPKLQIYSLQVQFRSCVLNFLFFNLDFFSAQERNNCFIQCSLCCLQTPGLSTSGGYPHVSSLWRTFILNIINQFIEKKKKIILPEWVNKSVLWKSQAKHSLYAPSYPNVDGNSWG